MRPILFAMTAAVVALGGHASAEPAHTVGALRALPPAEAAQVATSDLSSLLKPETGFMAGLVSRDGMNVTFVTPAYGTAFDGLCRRDRVKLRYAGPRSEGKPEDRVVAPYGVEATAWFADIGTSDDPRDAAAIASPACQALDGRADVAWFPALDAYEAAEVVLLLRKVRAQLTAGQAAWPSCDAKCRDAVLAPSHITRISNCAAPEAAARNAICYEIWTDRNIAITVKAKRFATVPITLPGDIESVSYSTLVLVD